MPALDLPPDVEATLQHFFTCEFTTVNKRGQPVTWPTLPYYDRPEGRIAVATSIAFPVKAYNARRHPQVALLFSDPSGTNRPELPAVLVQGDAEVGELLDSPPWAIEMFKTSLRRQPDSRRFIGNPIAQRLFQFYYQRIAILIRPRRILSWPRRDFAAEPIEIEVRHVE